MSGPGIDRRSDSITIRNGPFKIGASVMVACIPIALGVMSWGLLELIALSKQVGIIGERVSAMTTDMDRRLSTVEGDVRQGYRSDDAARDLRLRDLRIDRLERLLERDSR